MVKNLTFGFKVDNYICGIELNDNNVIILDEDSNPAAEFEPPASIMVQPTDDEED